MKIDRIRCGQRITLRLDGFVSFFACANPYGLLYWQDEHLAVSNLSRLGGRNDCIHNFVDYLVAYYAGDRDALDMQRAFGGGVGALGDQAIQFARATVEAD